MQKRIVGLEVYRLIHDETMTWYLSVIVYRADERGWERPKGYALHGSQQRRYWQMVEAMRRVWGATS